MDVQLILVPYDSGHRGARMGAGPERLIQRGRQAALAGAGHSVGVELIESDVAPPVEIATSFDLCRKLAGRVGATAQRGAFPLVLAGNCNTCVGTLAGLGPDPIGIIWLDGHGDFNTPETTISGFLDGMGLAVATGRCWGKLADSLPGFRPVPIQAAALLGWRNLDPLERVAIQGTPAAQVELAAIRRQGVEAALGPALDQIARSVGRVYLHLDVDVLDPAATPSNHLAPPGGLTLDELHVALAAVHRRLYVAGAALTAYDPALDPQGLTGAACLKLAAALVGAAP